jgi:hypothetical protein
VLARALDGLLVGALGVALGLRADPVGLLLGVALDGLGAVLGGLDDRPDLLGRRLGQRGAAAALAERCSVSSWSASSARCSSTASGS